MQESQGRSNHPLFGLLFPLCTQGVVQTVPHRAWKLKDLPVAVEFDRLPRGIKNGLAMVAAIEVGFQRAFQIFVQIPVQIAGNLLDCISTIH
jgi:hypothetical protein